jgi:hypothetical protein
MRSPPYRGRSDFRPRKLETPSNEQIRAAWDAIEEEEPEASTEYLMARVCDYFRGVIDNRHVAGALAETEAESP